MPGGYAEWDFPIDNPNEGIEVTARYNLAGGPDISGSRWGIDSDAAYEDDALYGVVTDAFQGSGSVTIKKGGVDQGTVPVVGKAFRWTPASIPGPGEYELVYNPPEGARGVSYVSQNVVKDVASYFSERYYTHEVWEADADGNGIPDGDEDALAQKFKPDISMHLNNLMKPYPSWVTTNWGALYEPGGTWHRPGRPPDEECAIMKDVFLKYEPQWDDGWAATFGPEDGTIDWPPGYWHEEINYINHMVNPPACAYYNLFKLGGKPIIQYWFFYPFNNWARYTLPFFPYTTFINDHEGDWEHVNIRVSSPDPARAYFEEAVFYFHEKRKTLGVAGVEILDQTHVKVYVGGHYKIEPGPRENTTPGFSKVLITPNYLSDYTYYEQSGGSYWRCGNFENVFNLGINVDESIAIEPGYQHIPWWAPGYELSPCRKAKTNVNWWWLTFPGPWGRWNVFLDYTSEFPHGYILVPLTGPPKSPWWHECWEAYQHPGYSEYGGTDSGGIAYAPPSAVNVNNPPSEAESFGPAVASFAPSASAGDYLSPVARAPFGPDADAPGADLPPAGDAPALTSPPALVGGDSLSPAGVGAPFGRTGPAAAASTASPLSASPNPVTSAATVIFKLEQPSRVYLAVYDLSGRRVATLADGSYAPGEHAAHWQADVPTGVYIYRLQAGDRVAVKKVVVAR